MQTTGPETVDSTFLILKYLKLIAYGKRPRYLTVKMLQSPRRMSCPETEVCTMRTFYISWGQTGNHTQGVSWNWTPANSWNQKSKFPNHWKKRRPITERQIDIGLYANNTRQLRKNNAKLMSVWDTVGAGLSPHAAPPTDSSRRLTLLAHTSQYIFFLFTVVI